MIRFRSSASYLSDDGLIPNCPNYFRIPGLDSRSPRPLAPHNYLAEFWSIWCLRLELPLAIFYQRSIKISCSLRYYRYYFHFPTFTWSDAFPHKPQCANFGVCGLSISFPTPTLDINGVIQAWWRWRKVSLFEVYRERGK